MQIAKPTPPALPSKYWANLTTRQFAHSVGEHTVAVLPVAAVEQHGPHLPVSVDLALCDAVVDACIPLLPVDCPVLFLPTQAIGKSNEHSRFPGTLTLSAQTLISLWTDIGESVARSGLKKLVLFNSHGGQVQVMDIVARDLRARLDLLVWSVNWFSLPLGKAADAFSKDEHRFGIHGGDMETSMMLALKAPGVDMAQARDFKSSSVTRAGEFPMLGTPGAAKLAWQTQDLNAMGAAGNASISTAAKGQALIDASALALAQLLQEVALVPLSTLVSQPHFPD